MSENTKPSNALEAAAFSIAEGVRDFVAAETQSAPVPLDAGAMTLVEKVSQCAAHICWECREAVITDVAMVYVAKCAKCCSHGQVLPLMFRAEPAAVTPLDGPTDTERLNTLNDILQQSSIDAWAIMGLDARHTDVREAIDQWVAEGAA